MLVVRFNAVQGGAIGAVKALTTGDPGVKAFECCGERRYFSNTATIIRLVRPQQAIRIVRRDNIHVRHHGANVTQTELCDQLIAVAQSFVEQLAERAQRPVGASEVVLFMLGVLSSPGS